VVGSFGESRPAGSPPVATMTTTGACPNCGSTSVGRFCAECGQERREGRPTVLRWLRELLDELTLDARLPRTLVLLVTRPGFLTQEWREGRRARYVSPLRLYLLASVFFFSVTFFLGIPGVSEIDVDPAVLTELGGSVDDLANQAIGRRMQGLFTLAAVAMVILLALWLRAVRWRSSLLFVDHLTFSLHVHTVVMFALTPAYFLLFFGLPGYVAAGLLTLYALAYVGRSWWNTYGRGGRVRRALALGVTGGFWLFSLLGLLIGELAVAVEIFDVGDVARNAGDRARASTSYAISRNAFQDGDVRRARYIAEEALRAYTRIDTADLVDHEPYHIAEMYRFAAKPESAAAHAGRLLATEPDNLLALGLAGISSAEAGDSAAARTHFTRLLELTDRSTENDDGHDATLRLRLFDGRAFLGRPLPEDAREHARRAYVGSEWAFEYGESARGRALAREALDHLESVDPSALLGHDDVHAAHLLARLGDRERAAARVQHVLEQNPEDLLALGLAAEAAEARGDAAAAAEYRARFRAAEENGVEPPDDHGPLLERYRAAARRGR